MSLPNGKAGVDASVPKATGKSGKTTEPISKPLFRKSRDPHPYSLKAELERDEREATLAAGRANEERRQAKRAAYWAATKADDEADPEEDDVDDAYAEEIRSLREEDDPESHSHQTAAERPTTSDLGVWASGTDEQKARVREFARHFDRDKVQKYSSHDLLLLGVLWSTWIKKTEEAIDKNDPDATRAGLKKLKGKKKWLASWLEKNRPLAVEKAMRQLLCEDPLNAKVRLLGMDKNCVKKHGNNHVAVAQNIDEEHTIPKVPAGSHGKHDVPEQFYSKEFKGRVVLIIQWTRKLIKKRMRERELSRQACKGVGNLQVVMSQVLYWVTPKPHGTILAGGKNAIKKDGIWWLRFKPSRFRGNTDLSVSAVRSAMERLEDLGLVERFQVDETEETYIRPCAESFAKEVEAIVAAPGYGMK